MSVLDKNIWYKIDKEFEEAIVKGIKFTRPIEHDTISIDCPICRNLLSNVEDVKSVRENDACESCYLIYYYKNKDKWEKGWRPKL